MTTMRMPLYAWINEHAPNVSDTMLWKRAWEHQMTFVRDNLACLVAWGLGAEERIAWVISTHRSKSIVLPVYQLERPDVGLRLVLRDNFYNWKLSVLSERPIEVDFSGLFHTTPPVEPAYTGDPLNPDYFEGFPKELVFGYYEPSDKRRWSAQLDTDEALWTTTFLILRFLGVIGSVLN